MRLLLNLRKRFGSNAGVAHIQNAADNGTLMPFVKVEEIADKLHRWSSYIKDTDANVQIIAMALHHLDEFIAKQREGPMKSELLQIYTSKLEAFGRDPTTEAEGLLKTLQEELVKVGSTQQTHAAIRGIGSTSRTPTVNFAGDDRKKQPCIKHFKEGLTCDKGNDCPYSHKQKLFKEWIQHAGTDPFGCAGCDRCGDPAADELVGRLRSVSDEMSSCATQATDAHPPARGETSG